MHSETIGEALRLQADRRPDSPFLFQADRRLSYLQVATQSSALAVGLRNLGVEQGDRIAIDLPNWPEFAVATFAAALLGATIVPLNPGYTPRELQFMLRHSEAVVAITAENWAGTDYLQLFEGLLIELPDLQYLVTVGEEDLWYDDRIFQFEDLVSSGMGRELEPVEQDPAADTFAILYTPGTTGTPKGVMLSHANLLSAARATADALALAESDVALCAVPLYHIFGLGAALLTTAVSGGSVVLQEPFDAAEALGLVERHGITVLHGVPTMFVMLLRHPDVGAFDLSSLRTGIVAGAPVAPELVDRARDQLVPDLEIAYGLTETSPTVTITSPSDPDELRVNSVGRPVAGVEVVVVDDEDRAVPAGALGEVAVGGPNVMLGYFRQPSETGSAFTAEGMLKTGDLAHLDAQGYLHIEGRKGDVIIRGGYNVHPREIENHLRSHPAVLDVVVVGVPNEVLGELICACVITAEGALITDSELQEFARKAIADYKVPDLIRFVEVLPSTPSGHARRKELARTVRSEIS